MKKLSQLSLEEKVGQLVLGQAQGIKMNKEFKDFIKEYKLGGFRVNQFNLASTGNKKNKLKSFLTSIKQEYGKGGLPTPLLAADQEGGSLSVFSDVLTNFPGNMALGATKNYNLAYKQGVIQGQELNKLGINLNFSPVADINLNKKNPVIGVRSFGEQPKEVAQFAKKLALGLNDGGVLNSAKHFPGHGNTQVDSHSDLPTNNIGFDRLLNSELIPFRQLIENSVDTIMVSHVLYPKLTSKPASLSKEIITELLRNELNYEGVVLSDDLEMKAITKHISVGKAVKRFIKAGGDIALVNGNLSSQKKAYEELLVAAQTGEIKKERINTAVKRILSLKQKPTRFSPSDVDKDKARQTADKIIKQAITLQQDPKDHLPLSKDNNLLVVIPQTPSLTEADTTGEEKNKLPSYLADYFTNVETVNLNIKSSKPIDKKLKAKIKASDFIIQGVIDGLRFPKQIDFLSKISKYKPVISISLRTPYDLELLPAETTSISCYSQSNVVMKRLVKFLTGANSFTGCSPVKVNKDEKV